MEPSLMLLLACVTPASAAVQPSFLESLLLATHQRPWLWGVYAFTVGLPIILFISFMWPDKRFGPPGHQYYYQTSDAAQPDDPEVSPPAQWRDVAGNSGGTAPRRRDTGSNQRRSGLGLKGRFNSQQGCDR